MRRHVGKGIQGACAPMAERCGGRFAAPGGLREQRVEQSEISEHSEHSDGLADARSFSRCSALRKRRGAYGCHLPARGGPPTCAGLLLAWWSVGGAVGGRGRFAARCALLQQALDFMQLFFLDSCFTALFFEVPAPL